jgi:hypothetical protein
LIGGTAASSTLTLESTSGAGTTDSIIFKTGSQATRMTIDTSGNVSIGGSGTSTGVNLVTNANIGGATTSYAHLNNGVVQSSASNAGLAYASSISVAASVTTTEVDHFWAFPNAGGAGSTITSQIGFNATASLGTTGAATITNAYGFFGNLASGTNRFNLYMAGTATNYMAGSLGIGTNAPAGKLSVGGNTPTTGQISSVAVSGGISLALSDNVNSSLYVKHAASLPVTIGTDSGGALAFATNGFTERMRIDSSGNVLIPSVYSSTSATAANVYVSSTGQLYRATASATASGTLIRAPQILTSGTSYTTPAGCNSIYVEVVGGGGGGGYGTAGTGGAGGGGYAAKYFTVAPSTAYTYAVGAGGIKGGTGGPPSAGGTGGNSTFTVGGTTITGSGGVGGSFYSGGSTVSIGGALGGAATNGDVNIPGQRGSDGYNNTSNLSWNGASGNSTLGMGSSMSVAASGSPPATGYAPTGYGGGGGGASVFAGVFAGTAGVIRVWEYT